MSLQDESQLEQKALLDFVRELSFVVDASQTATTQAQRAKMGEAILELSADWKVILSPMISYQIIQDVLVGMLRLSEETGKPIELIFTMDQRNKFELLLEHMKTLSAEIHSKFEQRHEPWIEVFREQVDLTPGQEGIKRVVSVHELAGLLTLANEMKDKAIESFNAHDFGKAVTCYVQINNLLKDVRSIRPEENSMIEDMIYRAARNLTIASLKNWEWGRAKLTCEKVLALSTKPDYVINLRRATACRELGQFQQAYNDIAIVITSSLSRSDPLLRKAFLMKKELQRIEKQSDAELRQSLSKGMSSQNIFSTSRNAPSAHYVTSSTVANMIQKLKYINNGSGQATGGRTTTTNKKTNIKLLDNEAVDIIQHEQFKLFSSPIVQASLEKIRFQAEMEESRFLHRLLPFKVQTQTGLLKEYGFLPSIDGLKAMERAIAAHMDRPEVCARSKELMVLLMGDVWSQSE